MKKYVITVNGNKYEVEVQEVGSIVTETPVAKTVTPSTPPPAAPKAAKPSQGSQNVNAPMPGNIVKVAVKVGDTVKKGDVLLVFEAMKMENELTSPASGTVIEINAKQGSTMAAGDLLVVIE